MTELDSLKIKEISEEASTFELFIQYLKDDLEIEYDTLSLDDQMLINEIWYRVPRVYERTEDNLPHTEEWYEKRRIEAERGWLSNHLMKCIICEKEYFVTSNVLHRGYGKFCSHGCSAVYVNKYCMKSPSKLEAIIADWLDVLDVEYIRQHPIVDDIIKTSVDFFMEPNICFYVDGDYWHSLSRYRKNYAHDILQNMYLPLLGYKIYRMSGSDILAGYRPFEILTVLSENRSNP